MLTTESMVTLFTRWKNTLKYLAFPGLAIINFATFELLSRLSQLEELIIEEGKHIPYLCTYIKLYLDNEFAL